MPSRAPTAPRAAPCSVGVRLCNTEANRNKQWRVFVYASALRHPPGRTSRLGISNATTPCMSNNTQELKARISSRKHELQSKLSELVADTRHEAKDMAKSVKTRLSELEETLKDGWDNLTDATVERLNNWLDREPEDKVNPKHRS